MITAYTPLLSNRAHTGFPVPVIFLLLHNKHQTNHHGYHVKPHYYP